MPPVESVLGKADEFLDRILASLGHDGIDVSEYELDHVCYRVETGERYASLKRALHKHGTLLTEAQISGRPIATYRLDEPLRYRGRAIYCIELPAPREGRPFPEGFEHAEFVIAQEFQAFIDAHPTAVFDTDGAHKSVNPDICVHYGGLAVKFHHRPLEYVIKYLQR